jgi:hypothetical protein
MSVSLKTRVAALEQQVARLQKGRKQNGGSGREWLEDLYGRFTDDPVFAKAMSLGRKYRRSLHPRVSKGKSK